MLGLLLILCSSILCFCQDTNEVCEAVYYSTISMEGAQCTSSGTACTEYKCEIGAATFVNFTFQCFNTTRMVFELSDRSTGMVSLYANNDSMAIHSFTNEIRVDVENSYNECVTTLQVTLNASGTTISEITITRVTQSTGNIMTSAPSPGCEEGKEESPCFTAARSPHTAAGTTLATSITTTPTTSYPFPQNTGNTSVIIGASVGVGSLLLIITVGAMVCSCCCKMKVKNHNDPVYELPNIPVYELPSIPVYELPNIPVYELPNIPVYDVPDVKASYKLSDVMTKNSAYNIIPFPEHQPPDRNGAELTRTSLSVYDHVPELSQHTDTMTQNSAYNIA